MSTKMRAVGIHGGTGPATALFIDEIPKPIPSAGQALVKIRAFGVNRMDILQRDGHYTPPPHVPQTLGLEFSGIVEEIGPGDPEGFHMGQEVFGLAYGGAYAEYITVSTKMLIRKPQELSWEEAAGIPETWFTAIQALLVIGEFRAGQSVLWHAGASSVSICGIQLAKAAGAKAIYATVGSQEKVDFLEKELGVTKAFNYRTDDWATEIQTLSGNAGVDLTLDFVGPSYLARDLHAAAPDGRIILLGLMGGRQLPEGVDFHTIVYKRLRVEGSTLRGRDEEYQRQLRDKLVSHALPKFCGGTLKVYIERVFRFEEVKAAHDLLESNTTKGKIICVIN